ncbi:hypothetical protein H5410_062747 [Solanum commersonii]|uniref:Uncharacterized protein n=1 Tax=Solanum commersonii TaxID=4109 RepID=A0A9J5WBT4_SOLCO|nr:hypothetical protein H5410_062747 [Solanum commersonii]
MEDDDEYSAHETSVGVSESKESPRKKVKRLKSSCLEEPYRVGSTPGPNGTTAPTTWSKPTEEGSQSKQKKSTLFALKSVYFLLAMMGFAFLSAGVPTRGPLRAGLEAAILSAL